MSTSFRRQDYYRILGTTPDADSRQIRRAYRLKVSVLHPDRNGQPKDFVRLQQAYEVLSNPIERTRYDMTMRLGPYAGRARSYRRSFDRLFDSLFSGLHAAVRSRSLVLEQVAEEQRRAG